MNKEFFWFNKTCQKARRYNDSCPGELSNDEPCRTLKQKTICTKISNGFKCKCPENYYYHSGYKICDEEKNVYNEKCDSENSSCNAKLGLRCLNKKCE